MVPPEDERASSKHILTNIFGESSFTPPLPLPDTRQNALLLLLHNHAHTQNPAFAYRPIYQGSTHRI